MLSFTYRAATREGRTLQGVGEAESAAALERTLASQGLYPLSVDPVAGGRVEGVRPRRAPLLSRRADVAEGISNLASLLEAGLPLDRSLEIAARSAGRADVAAALSEAREEIRAGGRFADALHRHPRLFPPVAVGLIRAADRGGHLPEAIRRVADYLERDQALRARITSALIYPCILLAAGVLALALLLLFVLPRFVVLLDEAGTALPASTAFLLGASSALSRVWPVLVLGAAVLGLAWRRWRGTEAGRLRSDRALLHVPLVGPLRARQAVARLARTLETLLSGGLPLAQALDIACTTVGDAAISEDVRAARLAVQRGEALSAALQRGQAFPFAFLRLVEVGEATGQLEVLLGRAGTMLEGEVERRMQRLVTLVEPILILCFGVAIGVVALSLLQAIYGVHADAF